MDAREIGAIGGSFFAIIAYLVLSVLQPAMAGLYIGFAVLFSVLFILSIGATLLTHITN